MDAKEEFEKIYKDLVWMFAMHSRTLHEITKIINHIHDLDGNTDWVQENVYLKEKLAELGWD